MVYKVENGVTTLNITYLMAHKMLMLESLFSYLNFTTIYLFVFFGIIIPQFTSKKCISKTIEIVKSKTVTA